MSSPIHANISYNNEQSRKRSPSFNAPRLDLVLKPSCSLGPFKLGHSLWHTVDYLRSHQSLFPQFHISYDEASPRLSSIVVSVRPNLNLVFHGTTQRLTMITLENLDISDGPSAQLEPSHRFVNLLYNGKVIYSKGTDRSPAVVLNRSSLHQLLGPTYPGWTEQRSNGSTSKLASGVKSAASTSQRRKKDSAFVQDEFILGYPGLAFTFIKKQGALGSSDVSEVDKFQPVSTVHIFRGSEPNEPQDTLVVPSSASPASLNDHLRPSSSSNTRGSKGSLSPQTDSAYSSHNSDRDRLALDTEAINVRAPTLLDAIITPGEKVTLHFAKNLSSSSPSLGSSTSPSSSFYTVNLVLGQTSTQDAMCELGSPQRIFYKEDDRMRIHSLSSGETRRDGESPFDSSSGNLASSVSEDHSHPQHQQQHQHRQQSHQPPQNTPFFYNYFDLGLDLLFSCDTSTMSSVSEAYAVSTTGQPRLEKVILHTNVPGDALFQRYNRCPWRILTPSSTSTENNRKTKQPSKASLSAEENGDGPAAASELTFKDTFEGFPPALSAGNEKETKGKPDKKLLSMELDRGTCAEFRPPTSSNVNTSAYDTRTTTVTGFKVDGTDDNGSGSGSNSSIEDQQGQVTSSNTATTRAASGGVHLDLSTRLVGRDDGLVLEVAKDGTVVGVVVF